MLNRAKYIRWPQAWCRISLPNSHFKKVLLTSPRPWPDLKLNPVLACVINSLSGNGTSNKLAPVYWPVSASLLILDNAKVAEAVSFYRSCDQVDLSLSFSKQKLAIMLCAHPGNCEQTHNLCAQCDTRRTAVSLVPTAENRTLRDVSVGRFSRTERINPHHSFSYVKNCYNVQQLCALTPASRSVSLPDSEGIFPPLEQMKMKNQALLDSDTKQLPVCVMGVGSSTRTRDWEKISSTYLVGILVACGLYNHELLSMQEAEEDMFAPKMTQYVRK